MTTYVLCKTLIHWLCSRSQPAIKVSIRGLSGAFVTYCNISWLFIYLFILLLLFLCHYYYNANSTLLSLLRFSYFITTYDAQASGACSALISCSQRGAVVEWLERLGYDTESRRRVVRLGFAIRRLENSLSRPSSKCVPFSSQRRIRQRKESNGLRLPFAVPKTQLNFNAYCPYGC